MTDEAVASALADNDLAHLREFYVVGSDNRLTIRSVIKLTECCKSLRWLGDLQDWKISSNSKVLKFGGWEARPTEPRPQQPFQTSRIIYSASDIVDKMLF